MKTTNEILVELLIRSQKISKFIDTHACNYTISAKVLRGTYASSLFYTCLDRYKAILLLTVRQLRGPALNLIRPMIEAWIKGTWIMLVPLEDEIGHITMNNEYWDEKDEDGKKKSTWNMCKELKEKNEFLGGMMKDVLDSVNKYLNDCVHTNNAHLNRYFSQQTQMIEPNFPDDEMALMLDLANTIALSSALHMQVTHTQDMDFLHPFVEELNNYQAYSRDLLKPLSP